MTPPEPGTSDHDLPDGDRRVDDAGEQFDALMTSAPVGLVFFDDRLRVEDLNEVAAQLAGGSRTAQRGKHAEEVFPGLGRQVTQVLEKVVTTGQSSDGFEVELPQGTDRQQRTWWCSYFPWQPAAGGPLHVGGVIVDVTARRLVELGRVEILADERAAREELERVRDRLAFVVHAGSRLAASLDVAMTLETVGDLMVPRFGRYCIVDLWDGSKLERVFVRGVESSDPELLDRIRSLSGTQAEGHPAIRAVRTGQPVVISATNEAMAAQVYDDEAAREIVLTTSGGHGYASIPLSTWGRVIGALTLVGSTQSGAQDLSSPEDLAMVEQVASRAAQSIENARLFDAERRLARSLQESERRQRQAARTLQESLLPATTPQPDELEVAARYLPGTEEADVGGDWYDVIPLAPGRTALVIGDVMGRGLRAATLMGQVRTAVRAYARAGLPPSELLALVDGVVGDLGEAEIVTCVYGVFDAVHGTLTYASAGHLPLLLVEPDGTAYRLDHETGIALGVATCAAPEHVIDLPPGSLIAFYTDGLVEHRDRDIDVGIAELLAVLRTQHGAPEAIGETVIDVLCPPPGYDDDAALLLARPRGRAGGGADPALSLPIPHDLTAVPFARGETDQALRRWGIAGELRDEILLSCGELVANALRHGAPPVHLEMRRRTRSIGVEVSDGATAPPQVRRPALSDEDGRGLILVTELASRWGWHRTPHGKTVWCEHEVAAAH